VTVDVEVDDVAVLLSPHGIRQTTEVENVRSRKAEEGILFVETDTVAHLDRKVMERTREQFGLNRIVHRFRSLPGGGESITVAPRSINLPP
jgi:hypothetical protein